MTINGIFPFEYVEKNSKVIIYGLGKYGMSYIEQVQATGWCEIVGVSDTNAEKRVKGIPFFAIEKLQDIEVDVIIIAISDVEKVNQVYWKLIENGICDSKIISALSRTGKDYRVIGGAINEACDLRVLLQIGGGLGDCIVCLSAYERIVGMLGNAVIDIKCRNEYGKVLYAGKKMIRFIIDKDEKINQDDYDLILSLEHEISVSKYEERRCKRLAPELNRAIQLIIGTDDNIRNDIYFYQYRYLVQMQRAAIKGWNRYRALGLGEVLNLSADMVHIDLNECFFSKYRELQLRKYITFNRGADKKREYEKDQTKVWPLSYYEQLIHMLKEKYSDYELVQLGDDNANEVKGADRFINSQNLEVIKYILKYSSLHFDCEGGLVHLATALGTKCVVVFGPTPLEYYGYPQNINIMADKCHNCMGLIKNWYVECLKGQEEPECMYAITSDMVFKRINEYLEAPEKSDIL